MFRTTPAQCLNLLRIYLSRNIYNKDQDIHKDLICSFSNGINNNYLPFRLFSGNWKNAKAISAGSLTLQRKRRSRLKKVEAKISTVPITPGHLCIALGFGEMRTVGRYFKKYTEFQKMSLDVLEARIETLKKNGISEERMRVAPWLLLRPYEELEEVVKNIASTLKLDFHVAVPLANFPEKRIMKIRKQWERDRAELAGFEGKSFANRIEYLANRLHLTNEDIGYMMGRRVVLSDYPLEKINAVLEVVEEAGICSEDLYSDPYIFTYGASSLIRRLNVARSHNVEKIKPWMLRENEYSLVEGWVKQKRESELLSGKNIFTFLETELGCTSNEVGGIVSKVSNFHTMKASKVRETIQFLKSNGYTTQEVLEAPWVLTHALGTIQLRYKQLEDLGLRPRINLLCLSSREYKNLVDRLQGNNKEDTNKNTSPS